MILDIIKGENKIVEYELSTSAGDPILFAVLLDATNVVITDYSGNSITKDKLSGALIEGSTTSSIQFEITDADLTPMDLGLLISNTEIHTTDTDFINSISIQTRKDELLLING